MLNPNSITSEQQSKAVDTLGDWSKWLIGVNFGAATGCMAILEGGVSSLIKPYLVGAIFFLATSILMSIFLFLTLPSIIQQLPIQNKTQKTVSIYDYQIMDHFSLRHLLAIQIGCFILGIICLLIWVMLKPAGR